MKVLIAAEYSGAVRDAFLALGHDAMSCDLLDTESPGPHYKGDVRDILHHQWDLLIAHPPCTYLCSSGLHWNKRVPGRDLLTLEALAFARIFIDGPETAHIPRRGVENPIGRISTAVRKPNQTKPYSRISLDTMQARQHAYGCTACPRCCLQAILHRALWMVKSAGQTRMTTARIV